MQIGRRRFSKILAKSLAGAWVLPAAWAQAKETGLPVPTSLAEVARRAQAQGQPLVLLISLPGCVYCELVRRNYLMPLLPEANLQAWQLDITNRRAPLLGFDGQPSTAEHQAKALKASFTPTVLFLGSQGQELAERLVGIAVPDFYGAYLEQRLTTARKAL